MEMWRSRTTNNTAEQWKQTHWKFPKAWISMDIGLFVLWITNNNTEFPTNNRTLSSAKSVILLTVLGQLKDLSATGGFGDSFEHKNSHILYIKTMVRIAFS